MANHTNLATSKLKEEKLQDVLEKVESYLQERKHKQLLEYEIRHMTLDFEYSKDTIPVARKSLSKTIEDISEIEPRFITQQQNLSRLQQEVERLEKEYAFVQERLEDLENKRLILPDLKAQVESMQEAVRMSSDILKPLQSRYQEVLLNKETLAKATEGLKAKLSQVNNEIPVMKNTRDILLGCIPEGFDPEVYHSIQEKEEIEKSITSYVSEVKGEIEKIKREMSEYTAQLEVKDKKKERLVSKNEQLQQKYNSLVAEVGDDSEKPIIEEEVNRLEGEKQRVAGEADQMTKEVSRLEAEMKTINEAVEREKKTKADSMERYTYLSSKRQEIEKFDNLEAAIEKLKKETEKHITDSKVNNRVLGVSSDITQDVDSLNGRLQSAIEYYNKQIEECDRTINSLLS